MIAAPDNPAQSWQARTKSLSDVAYPANLFPYTSFLLLTAKPEPAVRSKSQDDIRHGCWGGSCPLPPPRQGSLPGIPAMPLWQTSRRLALQRNPLPPPFPLLFFSPLFSQGRWLIFNSHVLPSGATGGGSQQKSACDERASSIKDGLSICASLALSSPSESLCFTPRVPASHIPAMLEGRPGAQEPPS